MRGVILEIVRQDATGCDRMRQDATGCQNESCQITCANRREFVIVSFCDNLAWLFRGGPFNSSRLGKWTQVIWDVILGRGAN